MSASASSTNVFGTRERILAGVLVFPALVLLSLLPLRPPEVVGTEAPATEFSAGRAAVHLQEITQETHPMGTEAHRQVREYLVGQIEALGLEAEVQSTSVSRRFGRAFGAGRVDNVFARLPGQGGGGTVLLMSHYDSVNHSLGASDAGSGVVALLEALRALTADEGALRNDLVFLFTDAEEAGLLGAQAFHVQHPLAQEVDVLLNFEARGAGGPSIMFETGPKTSGLMKLFAKASPRPLASSYSYDVYQMMQNDTDFTVFSKAGVAGFNFAYIHDVRPYHSILDNFERTDLRSVQHHGDYALALARALGDADLSDLREEPQKIFFNLPFLGLVIYSTTMAPILAVISLLLSVALFVSGFRRKRLHPGKVVLGLISYLGSIAFGGATAYAIHFFVYRPLVLGQGVISSSGTYHLGLILCAIAAAALLLGWVMSKLGPLNLTFGALLLWLGLTIFMGLQLPSSSYLSVWPFLAGLGAVWLLLRSEEGQVPRGLGWGLVALASVGLFLWVPMFSLIGAALEYLAPVLLAVLVGILLGVLLPQVFLLLGPSRRWVPSAVLFVVGLGIALMQCLGAGYDAREPRLYSLFYELDEENEFARWGTFARRPGAWEREFVGQEPNREPFKFLAGGETQVLAREAPVLEIPRLEVVDLEAVEAEVDESSDGEVAEGIFDENVSPDAVAEGPRRLRLSLRTTGPSHQTILKLASDSAFQKVELDGHAIPFHTVFPESGDSKGFLDLYLHGNLEPYELVVELDGPEPLELRSVTYGTVLPEAPEGIGPRPEDVGPNAYGMADVSLARQRFSF